jgi:hypothetical protein
VFVAAKANDEKQDEIKHCNNLNRADKSEIIYVLVLLHCTMCRHDPHFERFLAETRREALNDALNTHTALTV